MPGRAVEPLTRMDSLVTETAETACSALAERVIGDFSMARRVHGTHAALAVTGVCHTHEPTTDLVPGCAYCARQGNAFAGPASRPEARLDDVVAPRVMRIREELHALANDIERILAANV